MTKEAYIIFSKIPEPGYVKTRLQPDLSAEESARVQLIMLNKLIRNSKELSKSMTIFFAYQGFDNLITSRFLSGLPSFIHTFPQKQGSLGMKMSSAIQNVQDQGFGHVILTGSDVPQLNSEIIYKANESLNTNNIVLGPTYDGGYYLFGTSIYNVDPYLNTDISWSTSSVLDTTINLIHESNQKLYLMPTMVDVDFKADLNKVKEYVEE
ncbi:TIGR04282 family arsenosugar biosynthesis glycosyltransferase [Companilactobacillus allii]|uniref:Glycosyltransferase n=1 Tax=Companilactobacillus allii TaxID=1847728 RepID=A0A1P8Q2U2_9LACO|nr:TIGR04282 family arsenosugar biosynthesis glycosyltransferase [Companilactobacillus allii]APX72180.1 hypothetical protein BTM29_06250 [Companilactobacillus allii]USQ69280.1 TIGR04282 family arsenosugar biosynthesis glycosyltransferase [Companilactobacillus allii]